MKSSLSSRVIDSDPWQQGQGLLITLARSARTIISDAPKLQKLQFNQTKSNFMFRLVRMRSRNGGPSQNRAMSLKKWASGLDQTSVAAFAIMKMIYPVSLFAQMNWGNSNLHNKWRRSSEEAPIFASLASARRKTIRIHFRLVCRKNLEELKIN